MKEKLFMFWVSINQHPEVLGLLVGIFAYGLIWHYFGFKLALFVNIANIESMFRFDYYSNKLNKIGGESTR